MTLAVGKALALLATLLQREGLGTTEEIAGLLGLLAVSAADTEPLQADILGAWASVVEAGAAERDAA